MRGDDRAAPVSEEDGTGVTARCMAGGDVIILTRGRRSGNGPAWAESRGGGRRGWPGLEEK
jgi:hypothetical protein